MNTTDKLSEIQIKYQDDSTNITQSGLVMAHGVLESYSRARSLEAEVRAIRSDANVICNDLLNRFRVIDIFDPSLGRIHYKPEVKQTKTDPKALIAALLELGVDPSVIQKAKDVATKTTTLRSHFAFSLK